MPARIHLQPIDSCFPTKPGGFLFKGRGMAFHFWNRGIANIDEGDYVIFWRETKPLLNTWIIGCVSSPPHSSKSYLFGSQQHILDGGSHCLYILYLQYIWLFGLFCCHHNHYRGAQELMMLFVEHCINFIMSGAAIA